MGTTCWGELVRLPRLQQKQIDPTTPDTCLVDVLCISFASFKVQKNLSPSLNCLSALYQRISCYTFWNSRFQVSRPYGVWNKWTSKYTVTSGWYDEKHSVTGGKYKEKHWFDVCRIDHMFSDSPRDPRWQQCSKQNTCDQTIAESH